jgi:phosphatidylglycerophosphate synthase
MYHLLENSRNHKYKLEYIVMNEMYPAEKQKSERVVHPYGYWALRPLSLRPSLVLHRAGLSATACTAISAVFLVIGLVALVVAPWMPKYTWTLGVAGALFVNLYIYLDAVDGNLARLQTNGSPAGEFYDSTLNVFSGFSVPIAVSIYVYASGGSALVSAEPFISLMLVAGIGIALCRLFRRVVSDNVNRLSEDSDFSMVEKEPGVLRYFAAVVNSSVFPTLFVFLAADFLSLWLVGYFIFNFVALLFVFVKGVRHIG